MPQSARHRLPAEWEPQSGVMLTWPHAQTDWGDRLTAVFPTFTEIGAAIAARETLLSVCRTPEHAEQIRHRLLARGAPTARLIFCIAPSDDSWARDHGPLTTIDAGHTRLHDFVFNGWGNKHPARKDSAISGQMAAQNVFSDRDMESHDFVLEGGAIETDGAGTLLATRSSVISETRNPSLGQASIEALLGEWLGLKHFRWLDNGKLPGDDTDGHIDTLARFAGPQTILYTTAPPDDPAHAELVAMACELRAMRTPDGQPYRLVPLPFPGVHLDGEGRPLPASYANFLIINHAVLLPTYGVAEDHCAIRVLRSVFPQRRVVAIDCRELIRQNGSLHCLTMQFPAQLGLHSALEFAAA